MNSVRVRVQVGKNNGMLQLEKHKNEIQAMECAQSSHLIWISEAKLSEAIETEEKSLYCVHTNLILPHL